MTVSSTVLRATFSGNGAQTVFPYPFLIQDEDDILVQVEDVNGVITIQIIVTDYTISGVGSETGGNVTFLVAPLATDTVILTQNAPLSQNTDYPEGGRFPAAAHENALDKLTILAQQQQEQLDRSFSLSAATPSTVDSTVPNPTGNADEFLRVNATADGYIYSGITGLGSIGIPVVVSQGGTGGITGSITLVQGAARFSTVAENATVGGDDYSFNAGDAAQAGTDINGGTAIISGGASEGTGISQVEIRVAKAGSTGSVQNLPQLSVRYIAEALVILPHGTAAGNTGEIRMLELAAGGTEYTGFKAPDTLASSITYTMPTTASSGGQFLQSDVSNVLSWQTVNERRIEQVTFSSDGTSASTTTVMPFDNTTPQITEGAEFITQAFTPVNASSTLLIEWNLHTNTSGAAVTVIGLFRDAVVNALSSSAGAATTAGTITNNEGQFSESAASTSARTYRLRFGPATAGTARINATSGGDVLNGTISSWIKVTEILP